MDAAAGRGAGQVAAVVTDKDKVAEEVRRIFESPPRKPHGWNSHIETMRVLMRAERKRLGLA